MVISFWFVLCILAAQYLSYKYRYPIVEFGVYPRTFEGLRGIFTSPFVHSGFYHLLSNAVPLFLLGTTLLYFYRSIAWKAFMLMYLVSGLGTWLIGRPSWHIGASGIVYGLVAFLFTSGMLRKHPGLMAISLLVVFLYGSLVWGMLPLPLDMSWEAHLSGASGGILSAFVFRRMGPQRPVYQWEEEDEEASGDDNDIEFKQPEGPSENMDPDEAKPQQPVIRYIYKPGPKDNEEGA